MVSFQMLLKFCFLKFIVACFYNTCVRERLQRFLHPVRSRMFCWGKLNSTEDNSSHDNINGFDLLFGRTQITDVSIKEGLMTFLRDSDRKVTVVMSQERKFLFIIFL